MSKGMRQYAPKTVAERKSRSWAMNGLWLSIMEMADHCETEADFKQAVLELLEGTGEAYIECTKRQRAARIARECLVLSLRVAWRDTELRKADQRAESHTASLDGNGMAPTTAPCSAATSV